LFSKPHESKVLLKDESKVASVHKHHTMKKCIEMKLCAFLALAKVAVSGQLHSWSTLLSHQEPVVSFG